MSRRGQGEGSIYKREDGRWVGCLDLGWENGRRKRKSFYGKTRKEVSDALRDAIRDHPMGLPVAPAKQMLREYVTGWLETIVSRNCRPTTYRSYEQLARIHILPAFGDVQLASLSTQQVRGFLNQKKDAGLSSRTVQYLHAVLRKVLNSALKDQLVIRNVAALVEPPRVEAKEVQPLTPNEARQFLDAISTDRLSALFTVAISVGLRQGEALALRWRDIDLEAGTLRVRYALQRFKPKKPRKESESGLTEGGSKRKPKVPNEIHLVEPKTKKGRRTIELPNVTLTGLVAHRTRQAEERRLRGSAWTTPKVHCEGSWQEVDDFVFTTTVGTPLEGRNVTKHFQRMLRNAKIPNHRFHDLRHTAATLLAVQGVHPKAIQAVLGWDQSTMVDRYAHFVDEMRAHAATRMDAILRPKHQAPSKEQKPV